MDESVWPSVNELLRRAISHWKLFASGAAASILGFGLPAVGVNSVPLPVLGWAGVVLMGLAIVRAFHDVRVERDVANNRLQPRFGISDNGPSCYQRGETSAQGSYELRRIVVTNEGGRSIDEIRVHVVGVRHAKGEPLHTNLTPWLPLPLVPQHNKQSTPDDGFSLAPGESRPVDVVSTREKGTPGALRIQHSVSGHDALINVWGGEPHLFEIRVVGRDVPAVTRIACVCRKDGKLDLALVP